jgi:hypothetical protein
MTVGELIALLLPMDTDAEVDVETLDGEPLGDVFEAKHCCLGGHTFITLRITTEAAELHQDCGPCRCREM